MTVHQPLPEGSQLSSIYTDIQKLGTVIFVFTIPLIKTLCHKLVNLHTAMADIIRPLYIFFSFL